LIHTLFFNQALVIPDIEYLSACSKTKIFCAVDFWPNMKRSYSPTSGDPSARPTSRIQSAWVMQVWVQAELTFVSGHITASARVRFGEDEVDNENVFVVFRKKLELMLTITGWLAFGL
jgi:hypothetical protein